MLRRVLALLGIPAAVSDRWSSSRLTAQVAAENEILIYGPIVPAIDASFFTEFLGDDLVVSNNIFRDRLHAINGDVTVRINSPGGDVWEASGMMTALTERRNAGDAVTVIVDGLAASAASLVMLAGGDIRVAPLASIMIHQTSGLMHGTAQEFRDMAEFLDRMDRQAASLYAVRMQMTEDAVLDALKEERWYTGPEAVATGLADGVIELENRGTDNPEPQASQMFARRNMRLAALASAAP